MKNITLHTILIIVSCFFYISADAQVSPSIRNINFTKFDVFAQNSKVAIKLSTDGKVATNYFEIQKSSDGVTFKTIALILGPDPKQSTCDCYGCFDKLLNDSKSAYYRAKHIGADGTEQFTDAKQLANL